ncbi:MAG TPA: hypothetical protein VNJ08_03995 [Bacteriovoracaceae bacterium]|nr:hypothetical protein [Bacteriovoracaceae bacterium]
MKCNLIILSFFITFSVAGGWYLINDKKEVAGKGHEVTAKVSRTSASVKPN